LTAEQELYILKNNLNMAEACDRFGISEATYYRARQKHGVRVYGSNATAGRRK
jgi:hypothetical protein